MSSTDLSDDELEEIEELLAGCDIDANPIETEKQKNNQNGKKLKSADDLEFEYALLKGLGFEEHDDRQKGEGLKYKLKMQSAVVPGLSEYPQILITRKYSEKNPNGRFSAVQLDENGNIVKRGDNNPAWLTNDELKKLPPLMHFYKFRETGYVPPAIVVGTLVSEKGDSRCIEILGEQGEEPGLKIRYPAVLIKKNNEGTYFIPASVSMADAEGKPRMAIPRKIVIPEYEAEYTKISGLPLPKIEKKKNPKTEPAPEKKTMAEVTREQEKKRTAEEHSEQENISIYAELMGKCLGEGVNCVKEILAKEFHINDETKADLALRIAQSLFIDAGKNRRVPRYKGNQNDYQRQTVDSSFRDILL